VDKDAHNRRDDVKYNEEYLKVLDQMPSMHWRSGLDGQRDYFNQSWLNFTGRELDRELGAGWMEGVYPEDLEHYLRTYEDAVEQQKPFEIEYRLRNRSGQYCPILEVGQPWEDSQGNYAGHLGTCSDLTERKQMEEALKNANRALEAANTALVESEAMFKGLFEYAPDAVVAVNQKGNIILVNEGTLSMFGYTKDELVGQPIEILLPGSFTERHQNHVKNYVANPHRRPMGENLALFGQRKDGSSFPVDVNLGPLHIKETMIILATIRDMTEQKKAVEAIHEREALLSTATKSSPIVFFKVDRDGIIQLSLGQSLANRLYKVETVGKSIYEVYQKIPEVIQSFKRALTGETLTTVIQSDGIIYETTFEPVFDQTGGVSGVVGVASDVTRHRLVEAALSESEAHFRTIFNNAILGIFLVDPSCRLIETNRALQEMLDYSADELRNKDFFELMPGSDVKIIRRWVDDLMSGKNEHFQIEQRYKNKQDQVLWGRLAMSLFRNQDGKPLYGIGMVENITAQKQAEGELAELQRRLIDSAEMERLQLAQDLHDGPLQDLQAMNFEISIFESLISEKGTEELENMRAELDRVTKSIRSICGELRPPALAPFGLEKAIRSHAEHFQDLHPEIRLHLDLVKDGQSLSERVRLALFRIYQHSMANILRHSNAKSVNISLKLDDEQINLEIEDDGAGFRVPRRWIQLVREGHFGLVGSIERAESVGGKLEIRSAPGSGTTISVMVPRREEEQVTLRERFSSTNPSSGF